MLRIPRVMICGTSSGSGKTWITGGFLWALKKRGMNVRAFKCGPDYIDPMFHSKVLGTPCRNLDTYFTQGDVLGFLFQQGSRAVQSGGLAVVEGVMGYYDGIGGVSEQGSSYELACALGIPVILVVPCRGIGGSAAAMVKGYVTYREQSHIQGIVLNQVSEMLYPKLREKVERETNTPVVGYVPVRKDLALESRHLGLVTPDERKGFRDQFEELSRVLEKTLDIGRILQIADTAPDMARVPDPLGSLPALGAAVRIGIAWDEAFCFLYEDNLDFLKRAGAELVFFSPLHDRGLPDGLDGVIFPGGYPEIHARQLSANRSMLQSVREEAARIPVLAECGGFLYLHQVLEDAEGTPYPMAGVVRGKAYPRKRLTRFGYIELEAVSDQLLLQKGERIRAHEFHYWDSEDCGDGCIARKASGSRSWSCVHGGEYFYAGFPHIYFYANPAAGIRFVQKCAARRQGRAQCTPPQIAGVNFHTSSGTDGKGERVEGRNRDITGDRSGARGSGDADPEGSEGHSPQ